MVVAENRYLAEDAAARIAVDYEVLPAVVGPGRPGRRNTPCTTDIPDNIAAHLVQQVGDVDTAMAAAPHRLEFDLTDRAVLLDAVGGQGAFMPAGTRTTAACGSTRPPRRRPRCAPRSPPNSVCRCPRSR